MEKSTTEVKAKRTFMLKAKTTISLGIVIAVLIAIWTGIRSGAIIGIFYFFILTFILWAMAKAKRWI